MQNYLKAVESAVSRLLEARKEYYGIINEIFRESIPPIYFYNRNNSKSDIESGRQAWLQREDIKEREASSKEAIKKLEYEQFALSIIDGSLLQIAAKGIELYSNNIHNSTDLSLGCNTKVLKFCIGREIRNVPSGLIIYAGRNHYNHIEDGAELRKPTKQIIERLNENYVMHKSNLQFSFDQCSILPINRATEFVLLLGWENFSDFTKDLLIAEKI